MFDLYSMSKIYVTPDSAITPRDSAAHSCDVDEVSTIATPDSTITLINSTVRSGDVEKVRAVLNNHSKCIINCTDSSGLTPLHYACMEGNLYMVRALISEFKADINALNHENNTPLDVAALGGKEEVVSLLIECDTGTLGRSLLHSACYGDSVNLVRTLILKHKADINARDDQNNTPLHVAALCGKEEVVYVLIEEFDCDTRVKGAFGRSLLHIACNRGSVNLVRTLIRKHKADTNARDDKNDTPLHVAAFCGKEEVVSVLIEEFDCDTSVEGELGQSLLHNACYGDSVNLVRTLIRKHKADTNARDDKNDTPLHVAAFCGKEEVVSVLIEEFDCDTSVEGELGQSLLHNACYGDSVNLVRTLIRKHKADTNARDDKNDTPLHVAAFCGKEEVVSVLIEEFGCDTSVEGELGQSLLHIACNGGSVNLVRTLIRKHKADTNARDDKNDTPLHVAAFCGKEEVVSVLIEEFDCNISIKGALGRSLLHNACYGDSVNLVRTLIRKHKADTNARDDKNDTPLHVAAFCGKEEVVYVLIQEFDCDTRVKGAFGRSLLQSACNGGSVNLVRTLILKHKADIEARDDKNDTPLHVAAFCGKEEVVSVLIEEFDCNISVKGALGRSLLHNACYGDSVNLVRTLIRKHKADANARDDKNDTPLHVAAFCGKEEVVSVLIEEFDCDTSVKGTLGRSLLHSACYGDSVNLVRTLIRKHKADTNARDDKNNTPLHVAALCGKEEVVYVLIEEFDCDTRVKGALGRSLLQSACNGGSVNLVRTLIRKHKADIEARDDKNDTPLHVAAFCGKEEVVSVLIEEFDCDTSVKGGLGRSLLHKACYGGNLNLVRTLILKHKADINARDDQNNTPLHVAALCGKEEVVYVLIQEFDCDTRVKGAFGRSLLQSACNGGSVNLVRTLILKHKADIEDKNDTPLHVAAFHGKEEVVSVLIEEFDCEINVKGWLGQSILHKACTGGNVNLVKSLVLKHKILTLLVDEDGDTPLHLCAATSNMECLKALLFCNAPIMIRNNSGKTSRDVATAECRSVIDAYIESTKENIHLQYAVFQQCAKEKYSSAERITRIFVIGNPGAGKSTLVETLKREGFFDTFWRVTESSVPPHTAGIVPSIHTSKHYGRVLFYDFAGDPEYYSSHAAILENLVSLRNGDNIFVIVVDLRRGFYKSRLAVCYWFSFIQHQNFGVRKPSLILIGSHWDQISSSRVEEGRKMFEGLCENFNQYKFSYFMLDCCQPKSYKIAEVQKEIARITQGSPCYKLSLHASILLGLIEKDFSSVTAISVTKLLSHITDTGIQLPTEIHFLRSILYELHELGFIFIVDGNHLQFVLNISRLTNIVHKSLFSEESRKTLTAMCESHTTMKIGIIPRSVLEKILPENITVECLVQLQYCQQISNTDVGAFPSIADSDSTNQSFLFFPALCSADKGDMSWVTPPNLSYSIGWLARCIGSCDYFPPRFLHVLLLRLVFRFALTPNQAPGADLEHSYFQRHCTMWKTGVHWPMEEGVECMVELVNENREVAVILKSEEDAIENCISVFNGVISCVMEAKADFCHSNKLDFFLIDPTEDDNYLADDNLFAMSAVERVLVEGREVVHSINLKSRMRRTKIMCLRKLTHWYSLFSLDFKSVLHTLEDVVKGLYKFGLHLNIPTGLLDAMEDNFPNDVERRKRELVKAWLSSSQDHPCLWQLVQALQRIGESVLAEKIAEENGKFLQKCAVRWNMYAAMLQKTQRRILHRITMPLLLKPTSHCPTLFTSLLQPTSLGVGSQLMLCFLGGQPERKVAMYQACYYS